MLLSSSHHNPHPDTWPSVHVWKSLPRGVGADMHSGGHLQRHELWPNCCNPRLRRVLSSATPHPALSQQTFVRPPTSWGASCLSRNFLVATRPRNSEFAFSGLWSLVYQLSVCLPSVAF